MSDHNPIQQAVLSACATNAIDPRHCVISPQILIDGDVKARDGADILVLGEVNGSVTGEGRVVVGAGAKVHGRVKAGSLCIEGEVSNLNDGQDIVVEHQLHIRSTGALKANVIQYGSLVTDAGGRLEGMLKHVPAPVPPKHVQAVPANVPTGSERPMQSTARAAAAPDAAQEPARASGATATTATASASATSLAADPEPEPAPAPQMLAPKPLTSLATEATAHLAEPQRAPLLEAAPAVPDALSAPAAPAAVSMAPEAPQFDSPLAFMARPAAVVHELRPSLPPASAAQPQPAVQSIHVASEAVLPPTAAAVSAAVATPGDRPTEQPTTEQVLASPMSSAPANSATPRSSARPLLAGLPSLDGEFAPVELVQEERPVPTWLMRQTNV